MESRLAGLREGSFGLSLCSFIEPLTATLVNGGRRRSLFRRACARLWRGCLATRRSSRRSTRVLSWCAWTPRPRTRRTTRRRGCACWWATGESFFFPVSLIPLSPPCAPNFLRLPPQAVYLAVYRECPEFLPTHSQGKQSKLTPKLAALATLPPPTREWQHCLLLAPERGLWAAAVRSRVRRSSPRSAQRTDAQAPCTLGQKLHQGAALVGQAAAGGGRQRVHGHRL